MARGKDSGPEGYVSFPDFIPEGEEMKWPGMGRGGMCIDYLPESVCATDGVPQEGDATTKGMAKRRGRPPKAHGKMVPVE